mmetsp:Transcript_5190/g.14912  ORF Transcript_5190/g.14912 Transcript_5190/m.14912 type:complete len:288 (+) Transcript_5190:481-1344(+)
MQRGVGVAASAGGGAGAVCASFLEDLPPRLEQRKRRGGAHQVVQRRSRHVIESVDRCEQRVLDDGGADAGNSRRVQRGLPVVVMVVQRGEGGLLQDHPGGLLSGGVVQARATFPIPRIDAVRRGEPLVGEQQPQHRVVRGVVQGGGVGARRPRGGGGEVRARQQRLAMQRQAPLRRRVQRHVGSVQDALQAAVVLAVHEILEDASKAPGGDRGQQPRLGRARPPTAVREDLCADIGLVPLGRLLEDVHQIRQFQLGDVLVCQLRHALDEPLETHEGHANQLHYGAGL